MDNDLLEPCPNCDEDIDCTLSMCPHCNHDLSAPAPTQPAITTKVIKVEANEDDEINNKDDFKEPCPGCDREIDCTAIRCPFCKYDLSCAPPTPKVRKAREKTEKQKQEESDKQAALEAQIKRNEINGCPSGTQLIYVPALGRHGQPSLDFPELHLRKPDPTDAELLEWAENLRYAYPKHDRGWLSNHAIGYLCQTSKNKVLRDNKDKIIQLLGGDDYA